MWPVWLVCIAWPPKHAGRRRAPRVGVGRALARAPGKVRIAYRDFPLSFHPNAKPAAVAARCAGAQGKFWEMHDALFAQQRAIHARLSEAPRGGRGTGGTDEEGQLTPRMKILSELESESKSLFRQMGDRWNEGVLSIYETLTGGRPN